MRRDSMSKLKPWSLQHQYHVNYLSVYVFEYVCVQASGSGVPTSIDVDTTAAEPSSTVSTVLQSSAADVATVDDMAPVADVAAPTLRTINSAFTAFNDFPAAPNLTARKPSSRFPTTIHVGHAFTITSVPTSPERKPETLTKGSPLVTGDSALALALESGPSGSSFSTISPPKFSPCASTGAAHLPSAFVSARALESAPSGVSDGGYACDRSLSNMSSEAWTLDSKPSTATIIQRASLESKPSAAATMQRAPLESYTPNHEGPAGDLEAVCDEEGSPRMPQPPPVFLQRRACLGGSGRAHEDEPSSEESASKSSSDALESSSTAASASEAPQSTTVTSAALRDHDQATSLHTPTPLSATLDLDSGSGRCGEVEAATPAAAVCSKWLTASGAIVAEGVFSKLPEEVEHTHAAEVSDECFSDACARTDTLTQRTFSSRVVSSTLVIRRVASSHAGSKDEIFSSWNFDTDAASQSHSVAYSLASVKSGPRSGGSSPGLKSRKEEAPVPLHDEGNSEVEGKTAAAGVPSTPDSHAPAESARSTAAENRKPLQCGTFSSLEAQGTSAARHAMQIDSEVDMSADKLSCQQQSDRDSDIDIPYAASTDPVGPNIPAPLNAADRSNASVASSEIVNSRAVPVVEEQREPEVSGHAAPARTSAVFSVGRFMVATNKGEVRIPCL